MGVVIVAGPSGSGKSHLGERLGWTVLRLDDFYREGDDPDYFQTFSIDGYAFGINVVLYAMSH